MWGLLNLIPQSKLSLEDIDYQKKMERNWIKLKLCIRWRSMLVCEFRTQKFWLLNTSLKIIKFCLFKSAALNLKGTKCPGITVPGQWEQHIQLTVTQDISLWSFSQEAPINHQLLKLQLVWNTINGMNIGIMIGDTVWATA